MTRGMGRRSLALTAAATLTLGGLVFAAPAVAEETPDGQPPAEIVDAAENAQDAGVEIVAVGVNAAGDDVVVVTESSVDSAEGEAAVKSFAAEADVKDAKIVTIASAPEDWAEGDVVGGQGYAGFDDEGYMYACSIGFTAFTPSGDPAFLSAGHCAFDRTGDPITQVALTVPSQEPAVDKNNPGYGFDGDPILLGEFAFAQNGGTGGTPGAKDDPNSTDIAAVDIIGDYNLLPEVTDWSTPGDSLYSLADGTVPVHNVAAPAVGQVSKSGRTSGFTTGEIDPSNPDHVTDGWAQIEGVWSRGFASDVVAGPGDSGGSVIQGNAAVGLIKGGSEATPTSPQWTWSVSLVHALPITGGYEVALDLAAPTVTPESGSTVERGSTITGTAPIGAKVVEITVGGETTEAKVADGKFSFKLSNKGEFSYSFTSVNGYSRSATTTWDVKVVPPPVPAPVITTPADGSAAAAPLTSISGTGVAGHTVEVSLGNGSSGTSFEPVTVGEDGTWTVDGLSVETYGEYTISAQQFRNAEEFSGVVEATFSLAPAAPVITSIFDGQVFGPTAGPTGLSGTGIEGASIKVALNGTDAASASAVAALAAESGSYSATVVDGEWSIEFDAALEPGSYTVRAVQSVDGVNSATAATLAFSVSAPAPAPAPGGNGGNGGGADAPSAGGDGELATTGMDNTVTLTASAGALALISAGIVLLIVRRRKLVQD